MLDRLSLYLAAFVIPAVMTVLLGAIVVLTWPLVPLLALGAACVLGCRLLICLMDDRP